jgi:hypothetical protein
VLNARAGSADHVDSRFARHRAKCASAQASPPITDPVVIIEKLTETNRARDQLAPVATERALMEPVEDVPHNSSSLPWTESFLAGLARAMADSEVPSIVPDESGGGNVRPVADDYLAIPEFLRRAITKETTSAAIVRTPEDVCPTRA